MLLNQILFTAMINKIISKTMSSRNMIDKTKVNKNRFHKNLFLNHKLKIKSISNPQHK